VKSSPSFLSRIEAINIYKRGNTRAPHKPLYLLLCIASLQKQQPRLRPFTAIEADLAEALRRFGLSTAKVNALYPFWRLQNDGLAEVYPSGPYVMRAGKPEEPTRNSLMGQNAHGGLLESDYNALSGNLDLQSRAVHRILNDHFPQSIHEDILDFFSIRLATLRASDTNTAAQFRTGVLDAYGRCCAFTGYAMTYRGESPGLEAAHICWAQSGGNDEISNGIAMTTLMRKLFHLGLLGIDEKFVIRFSDELTDAQAPARSLLSLGGKPLRLPAEKKNWPDSDSLAWHRKWVFRG
jgi:putative restriction endonuclease